MRGKKRQAFFLEGDAPCVKTLQPQRMREKKKRGL
jgi:hypothetical protein